MAAGARSAGQAGVCVSQDDQQVNPQPSGGARSQGATTTNADAAPDGGAESTVGTGTSIALGCIAGTILLIVFALILLGIMTLL